MPLRRLALTALAVLILLLSGGIGAGMKWGGWHPVPALSLDLAGGTQIILQATSRDGSEIDPDAMEQARQIIAQRVNAMGVAETEITVQGGTNIVIDVPGALDQETSEALRQTAAMGFRPVLGVVAPEGSGEALPSDGGGDAPSDAGGDAGDEETSTPPADPSQLQFPPLISTDPQMAPPPTQPGQDGLLHPAWSMDWVTSEIQAELMSVDCTDPAAQQERVAEAAPGEPVVACDSEGTQKFVLGPQVVAGSGVRDASVGTDMTPTGQPTGYYVANLRLHEDAAQSFSQMTTALHGGEGATPAFAIVLDGQVISAPTVENPTAAEASISGQFSQEEATQLADQLRFGALPLEFEVASEQQVSATLGSDQLEKGLIAGLIGLALVVLYAIGQYRALAMATTGSLLVMGMLTYGILTVLSNIPEIGYRLSLAGVVGLIVSIAFTADSFIVYFERVRDEIRDGRGIVAAVDHGWARARQTILASDAVNLIAALVLYALSTGGVRGFAFVLGLTTILDLLVVFLFTHPLLQSLVRTRFFGKGHPMSGLDPAMLGRDVPAYAGRGRIRAGQERGIRKRGAREEEHEPPRLTLAERKALRAREAEAEAPPDDQASPATETDPEPSSDDAGEEKR